MKGQLHTLRRQPPEVDIRCATMIGSKRYALIAFQLCQFRHVALMPAVHLIAVRITLVAVYQSVVLPIHMLIFSNSAAKVRLFFDIRKFFRQKKYLRTQFLQINLHISEIICNFAAEMNSTLRDIKQLGRQVIPAGGHLWLFGSRARGDFRPDSDWDLLVVLDKNKLTQTDYDEVTYPFTELGWTLNEQINPIMYTRANWEKNSFTPFYHNVQEDGILLQ